MSRILLAASTVASFVITGYAAVSFPSSIHSPQAFVKLALKPAIEQIEKFKRDKDFHRDGNKLFLGKLSSDCYPEHQHVISSSQKHKRGRYTARLVVESCHIGSKSVIFTYSDENGAYPLEKLLELKIPEIKNYKFFKAELSNFLTVTSRKGHKNITIEIFHSQGGFSLSHNFSISLTQRHQSPTISTRKYLTSIGSSHQTENYELTVELNSTRVKFYSHEQKQVSEKDFIEIYKEVITASLANISNLANPFGPSFGQITVSD